MIQKNNDKTKQNRYEENAIVLDVYTENFSSDKKFVMAIGINNFNLLELIPKFDTEIEILENVYIGEDKRDKIQYIKKSLNYDNLTENSKDELLDALKKIVKIREKEFINFLNFAGPISLKKHSLELISGIGKKYVTTLIDIRRDNFIDFEDVIKKCSFLTNPIEAISKRILEELENKDDLKFFIKK
jgi:putative nucleotide binding protein